MRRPPEERCVEIRGDGFEIVNNTFHRSFVRVDGNSGFIISNTIREPDFSVAAWQAFEAYGDDIVIARNIVMGKFGTRLEIIGTRNIVESNIVDTIYLGISFDGAGNFVGGNRARAATPYSNLEAQTDWGGNVSY